MKRTKTFFPRGVAILATTIWVLIAAVASAESNSATSTSPQAAGAVAAKPTSYDLAMAKIFNAQALGEYVKVSDALIDQVDPAEGNGQALNVETKSGLSLQFSTIKNELATMYYFSVSRKGEELHYSEAVKLAALFGDRVGLTHPIIVTEGEKPIFYCEWLIKPKEWKKYHKSMLEQRTKNRQIADPITALNLAVERELSARSASPKS